MTGNNLKYAVLTGATGGIGRCICRRLLAQGYRIFIPCRNESKGEIFRKEMADALAEIRKENAGSLCLLPADLESFASADAFAGRVLRELGDSGAKLHLLMNNAGIIAPAFALTQDGFERSLQVNFLSARRLTEALLPAMADGGRVVNTVSCTIGTARPDPYTAGWLRIPADPEAFAPALERYKLTGTLLSGQEKHFKNLKNYANSKLLLAAYTCRLHEKLRKEGRPVSVFGADPGVVDTGIITMHRWYDPLADLFFRPFIKSPEKGALPLLRAAEYPGTPPESLLFKGNRAGRWTLKV